MHCPEHKTYTATRIPRNKCFSCWRLYAEKNNIDVEKIIERPSTSEARASWLRESIDDIIYAPLESEQKKSAIATFVTTAEFIEAEEVKEETDEVKPARGVKI